ncbi:MAG: DNA repair exonuclease, partial [Candidatus Hydrothermarchaeales archaeon]
MRFAHISDTHLGYRQYNLEEREEDFYVAFREAVDKIIEARCDFVLHCGDLFDEARPHIKAMLEVQDALDKLEKAGISFYAITGNHDRMVRKGSYPPHSLYKRMNLLTIDEPMFERDGILICGLPYIPKSYGNVLRDKLDELADKAKGFEKAILMLHQGVDKYIGFETAYELKIGDIPRGFDYYAMGHLHFRRVDEFDGGKLAYPGSTEIWRMDELGDYEKNGKGFYIVDTKNFDVQKIDLENIRPHISDAVGNEEDIDRIKKIVTGMSGPVLHLEVAAKAVDYAGMYQRLVDELRERVLYLDLKRKPIEEEEKAFEGKGVSVGELLEEALRSTDRTEEEM